MGQRKQGTANGSATGTLGAQMLPRCMRAWFICLLKDQDTSQWGHKQIQMCCHHTPGWNHPTLTMTSALHSWYRKYSLSSQWSLQVYGRKRAELGCSGAQEGRAEVCGTGGQGWGSDPVSHAQVCQEGPQLWQGLSPAKTRSLSQLLPKGTLGTVRCHV